MGEGIGSCGEGRWYVRGSGGGWSGVCVSGIEFQQGDCGSVVGGVFHVGGQMGTRWGRG